MIVLNRGDYWQCARVIPKNGLEALRAKGPDAFRTMIAESLLFDEEQTSAIKDWDLVKLLSVQVNSLKQWWMPGILCIGDAAHAMSPIGGVGINLAIQDAVCTANMLTSALRDNAPVADALLAACSSAAHFQHGSRSA